MTGDVSGVGSSSDDIGNNSANTGELVPKTPIDLRAELGVAKKDNIKGDALSVSSRAKLKSNWQMKLGRVLGGLVGVAVLLLIIAAIAASHGALLGVLPFLGTLHAALAPTVALTCLEPVFAFLLVGGAAGALYARGKEKAKDELLPESTKLIKELEKEVLGEGLSVSEGEIADKLASQESTVLSSQVGREFIKLKREFGLSFQGFPNLGKFFCFFWSGGPYTTLKALGNIPQYGSVIKNYANEEQLKKDSVNADKNRAERSAALDDLNRLRNTQCDRLVWGMNAMGTAYAEAPEIAALDRNILKLHILFDAAKDNETNVSKINEVLNDQRKLRQKLIKARLGLSAKPAHQEAYKALFSQDLNSPIKSVFSITDDLNTLDQYYVEQRGQILEAVNILLSKRKDATISDINALVKGLASKMKGTEYTYDLYGVSSTRESVIKAALAFAETLDPGAIPEKLAFSGNASPMTRSKAGLGFSIVGMLVADVGSAVIHALPVPGSSGLGGAITGLAVGVETGLIERGIKESPGVVARNCFNSPSCWYGSPYGQAPTTPTLKAKV